MQRTDGDPPEQMNEDFASLLAHYLDNPDSHLRLTRGELVYGTVVRVSDKEILIDIGAKREGLVPASDLTRLDTAMRARLVVGAQVPAVVVNPQNLDGEIVLSVSLSQQESDWVEAHQLLESGEVIEREVVGYNKGGLTVSFGSIRGFIPASHVADSAQAEETGERQNQMSSYVGRKLPVKTIEVDRKRRRLVFSHRLAEQELRLQRKAQLLDTLAVGQTVTGVVTAIRPFGAFVDLGGADGLIHISELDWRPFKHPGEVVHVGDTVAVVVLRLDEDRHRIALSRRRALPNPWQTAAQRYAPGTVARARITKVMDFGAFAELEAGIEGLIHVSEVAEQPVRHPREVVSPGQEVLVQVLRIEPERERMGLSMRRVRGNWIVGDTAESSKKLDLIENEYFDTENTDR
jgi:small subunit ribosomal protein S1